MHVTAIDFRSTIVPTATLYKSIQSAGNFRRMDVITFSCYGGAMMQRDIDSCLPIKSMFVSFAGDSQPGVRAGDYRLSQNIHSMKSVFRFNPNALKFLVEVVGEHVRDGYSTDIVAIASGMNKKVIFKAIDKSAEWSWSKIGRK